jgi:hypothetical protein
MISTVTNSTAAIFNSSTVAGAINIVGVIILISLLILKEFTSDSSDSRLHKLNQALNVGIFPLVIAFALIVLFKVVEVLN